VYSSAHASSEAVGSYYRTVMVYIIAGFCLIQFVVLLFTWPQKIGHLRKQLGRLSSADSRAVEARH